jgi:hypothetical protein
MTSKIDTEKFKTKRNVIREYPFLRIRGKWLSSLGFIPGVTIFITPDTGGLLLTKKKNPVTRQMLISTIEDLVEGFSDADMIDDARQIVDAKKLLSKI